MTRHEAPSPVLRVAAVCVLAAVCLSGLLQLALDIDLLDYATHLPGCLFRRLTGIDCPGCGMTRGFLLLGQLRISDAIGLHPLAPGLLAVTVAIAAGANPARRLKQRGVSAVLLVFVIGLWIQRLVL